MATYTQQGRRIGVSTPLGTDALLLQTIRGHEQISGLFDFHLEMLSEKDTLDPKAILGKGVTFWIEYPDQGQRYFNGICTRFAYLGRGDRLSLYRAEVVPWLWFLTRTADCRIFQNKTVPDIVKQVFDDLGLKDYSFDVKGSHPAWDYCCQYRETDFQFISRLMEQEGIFYFFKHENNKHTLMVSDHKGAYKDCKDAAVEFETLLSVGNKFDQISRWEHSYEFRSGKFAQTDYNFLTPSTSLMSTTNSTVKLDGNSRFEFYDYPGKFEKKADGEEATKIRMEAEEARFDTVRGASHCRSFSPGSKFKLKKHHAKPEECKGYVLTSVRHSISIAGDYTTGNGDSSEDGYENEFTCIPDTVVFRPAKSSNKPMIHGLQTAVVTGPPGEEIYVDKYGRVKVQFHWDREGKKDDKSSCWVRVSQNHAGKGWGGIDIPRIGEEVVISFLEGDIDRPIVMGRVYHAESMPPFTLPAEMTRTGWKTKTHKGSGYNEITMDDTAGKELIRIHGQYDMDSTIEHDLREHVLNNRTRDVTVNETITVGSNRTETVGANESLSVGLTRTVLIGVNDMLTVGAAQEITVGGARTVTVGGAMATTVGGAIATSVGGPMTIDVGGAMTESVGGNLAQSVGKKIAVDAGDEISLKTGAASIVMKKDGTIEIKGKDVLITATNSITERASASLDMDGGKFTLNASAGMGSVKSSTITEVKGASVKINC